MLGRSFFPNMNNNECRVQHQATVRSSYSHTIGWDLATSVSRVHEGSVTRHWPRPVFFFFFAMWVLVPLLNRQTEAPAWIITEPELPCIFCEVRIPQTLWQVGWKGGEFFLLSARIYSVTVRWKGGLHHHHCSFRTLRFPPLAGIE